MKPGENIPSSYKDPKENSINNPQNPGWFTIGETNLRYDKENKKRKCEADNEMLHLCEHQNHLNHYASSQEQTKSPCSSYSRILTEFLV